jgi:hypothetical protein
VAAETCTNCGQNAVHQAYVGTAARPRWIGYCCECFDHGWRNQRLIPGQECGFELVEVPAPVLPPRREWRRKAIADEDADRA